MSRWLITRPADDAASLAAMLRASGHRPIVAPLLSIEDRPEARLDLAGVQALLFTSANGVRAFAQREKARNLPAFTVGEASADAARRAGFRLVRSASGDSAALAGLVRQTLEPANGRLLHVAGSDVAGDLAGALRTCGFDAERVVLYKAVALAALPDVAAQALRDRTLDGVLLFSARTAELFVRLTDQAALSDRLANLTAACLSKTVADRLDAGSWARVRVAEQPDVAAMMALIAAPRPAALAERAEVRMVFAQDPSDTGTEREGASANPTDTGPAEQVIAAFGGIRPMAAKLNVPVTTVQGWKKRGVIPDTRREEIRAAVARFGIALDPALLSAAVGPEDAAASETPRSMVTGGAVTGGVPEADFSMPTTAAEPSRAAPERDAAAPAETPAQPARPPERPVQPSVQPPVQSTAPSAAPSSATSPPEARPDAGRRAAERTAERTAERPAERAEAATPRPVLTRTGTPAPMRVGPSAVAWLALVASVLALFGVITLPFWNSTILGGPSQSELVERVAALEAGASLPAAEEAAIADLSARLATLEDREIPPGTAGADVAALADRVTALERDLAQAGDPAAVAALGSRLSVLEQQTAAPTAAVEELAGRFGQLTGRIEALEPLAARLQTVEGRIGDVAAQTASLADRLDRADQRTDEIAARLDDVAALAEQARAADGETQALVLAVTQLRDALAGGAPFAPALQPVDTLASDDPELAQAVEPLRPLAAQGVPGRAALIAGFDATARAVREAAAVSTDGDWLDQVRASVRGLVTVRPAAGEVAGNDVDAALARAEHRLQTGDMAGAVEALGVLQGAPAEAAAPWLRDARARLAADQAVERLTALAVARLAAPPEAAAGAPPEPGLEPQPEPEPAIEGAPEPSAQPSAPAGAGAETP